MEHLKPGAKDNKEEVPNPQPIEIVELDGQNRKILTFSKGSFKRCVIKYAGKVFGIARVRNGFAIAAAKHDQVLEIYKDNDDSNPSKNTLADITERTIYIDVENGRQINNPRNYKGELLVIAAKNGLSVEVEVKMGQAGGETVVEDVAEETQLEAATTLEGSDSPNGTIEASTEPQAQLLETNADDKQPEGATKIVLIPSEEILPPQEQLTIKLTEEDEDGLSIIFNGNTLASLKRTAETIKLNDVGRIQVGQTIFVTEGGDVASSEDNFIGSSPLAFTIKNDGEGKVVISSKTILKIRRAVTLLDNNEQDIPVGPDTTPDDERCQDIYGTDCTANNNDTQTDKNTPQKLIIPSGYKHLFDLSGSGRLTLEVGESTVHIELIEGGDNNYLEISDPSGRVLAYLLPIFSNLGNATYLLNCNPDVNTDLVEIGFSIGTDGDEKSPTTIEIRNTLGNTVKLYFFEKEEDQEEVESGYELTEEALKLLGKVFSTTENPLRTTANLAEEVRGKLQTAKVIDENTKEQIKTFVKLYIILELTRYKTIFETGKTHVDHFITAIAEKLNVSSDSIKGIVEAEFNQLLNVVNDSVKDPIQQKATEPDTAVDETELYPDKMTVGNFARVFLTIKKRAYEDRIKTDEPHSNNYWDSLAKAFAVDFALTHGHLKGPGSTYAKFAEGFIKIYGTPTSTDKNVLANAFGVIKDYVEANNIEKAALPTGDNNVAVNKPGEFAEIIEVNLPAFNELPTDLEHTLQEKLLEYGRRRQDLETTVKIAFVDQVLKQRSFVLEEARLQELAKTVQEALPSASRENIVIMIKDVILTLYTAYFLPNLTAVQQQPRRNDSLPDQQVIEETPEKLAERAMMHDPRYQQLFGIPKDHKDRKPEQSRELDIRKMDFTTAKAAIQQVLKSEWLSNADDQKLAELTIILAAFDPKKDPISLVIDCINRVLELNIKGTPSSKLVANTVRLIELAKAYVDAEQKFIWYRDGVTPLNQKRAVANVLVAKEIVAGLIKANDKKDPKGFLKALKSAAPENVIDYFAKRFEVLAGLSDREKIEKLSEIIGLDPLPNIFVRTWQSLTNSDQVRARAEKEATLLTLVRLAESCHRLKVDIERTERDLLDVKREIAKKAAGFNN